jgi:thiamine monophosphate synthase
LAAPVVALGGINAENANRLRGRGFSGLGAIDAFL